MFKIGTFSQLTGVTVKALHYYDQLELLKPAHVDRFTGYRYYTITQVDRLNRIMALKDLGLSLDEVGQILSDSLSIAELRGMLRLKQAQLRQTIAEEQARLDRVEARLKQIEREGELPANAVVVREIPALHVLRYREIIPHTGEIGSFFERIRDALRCSGVQATGAWLTLYWEQEYKENDIDVEWAIPIDNNAPPSLRIDDDRYMKEGMLPSVQVASTVCRMESYTDVYLANRHLCAWIENNGYRVSDAPGREIYAVAPQPDEPLIFEIQLPIER